MITESEAAIPLETTLHAFRNQEKTKQILTIDIVTGKNILRRGRGRHFGPVSRLVSSSI